jgi:polysaccharide biosynthesis protein PslJ
LSAPVIHPNDFEPALATERTYVTRLRIGRLDAAAVLSVMILLLMLIPTNLVLPSTTADVGRPAEIMCVVIFGWWVASRCHPRLALPGPQPIRWAVLLFVVSLLVSYAIGFERGLTVIEANAADRLLLGAAAFIGVILMSADGLSNWGRLRLVLQVFVWCSVFMAVLGLLQQILPFDPVQYIDIPGLQVGAPGGGAQVRGAAIRVAGTTAHPLEMAATLVLAWPIALHFGIHAGTPKQRRRYMFATALITFGIFETISRSGMIAMVIAALVLTPLWNWRRRYNVAVFGVGMLVALAGASPSIGRTIFNLFAEADNDPSITSRTERYAMVGYYFTQRPWFGRGTGTWVPPMYQYLDNQWMRTALENGVVGVAVLALLHIIALSLAVIALRRASTPADRHLCLALVAIQLEAIFIAYTFDVLAYSTYTTMLGIMIGVCGTVWRFTHPARQVRTSTPRWFGQ